MKIIFASGILAAFAGLPWVTEADASGGDRMPAGGAFMSSHVDDPYHDPHSLYSRRRGRGQILGAPMLSENAGAKGGPAGPTLRRGAVDPNWATGSLTRRRADQSARRRSEHRFGERERGKTMT